MPARFDHSAQWENKQMLRSLLEELRGRALTAEQAFFGRRARELRAHAAMATDSAVAAARRRHAAELEMRAAALADDRGARDFRK